MLVSASAWTLGITARVIHPGETPEGIVEALVKRLGLPAVRAATRQAMRLLGSHFVLGQTIDEALARARAATANISIPSTCWARAPAPPPTPRAISSLMPAPSTAIGRSAGNAALPQRPGISVKLSALHPRYEPLSRERVLKELTPRLLELARLAKSHELNFTVDAEEADRLELSLDVIGAALARSLARRLGRLRPRGAGLSEARRAVIDWIAEAGRKRSTAG